MAEKVLFKKEMTRNSLIWSCRCEVNSVQSESWWGWLTRWRGCYEYVSPKMPLQSLLFSILWSISLMHNLASKCFDHLEIIEMSIFIPCGLDSSRSSWTPIVEFHYNHHHMDTVGHLSYASIPQHYLVHEKSLSSFVDCSPQASSFASLDSSKSFSTAICSNTEALLVPPFADLISTLLS